MSSCFGAEYTGKDDYVKDGGEDLFNQDAFRSFTDSIGIRLQKAIHFGKNFLGLP